MECTEVFDCYMASVLVYTGWAIPGVAISAIPGVAIPYIPTTVISYKVLICSLLLS